jgi:hypothetical protein
VATLTNQEPRGKCALLSSKQGKRISTTGQVPIGGKKTRQPNPSRLIPPPISQEKAASERREADKRLDFWRDPTAVENRRTKREGGALRTGAGPGRHQRRRRQAPPTGGVDGGGRTGRNRVAFVGCSDVDLIGEGTRSRLLACLCFRLFRDRIFFKEQTMENGQSPRSGGVY